MIKAIITNYQNACEAIVEAFCEKQEMSFEHWVDIGNIVLCSDFFLNLSDIIYDIETDQPKGRIIEWYDISLEAYGKKEGYINYSTWCRLTPASSPQQSDSAS